MILYILNRFHNLCHICDIMVTFLLSETTYVHCKLLYCIVTTIIIVFTECYIIGHWRLKWLTCNSTPNSVNKYNSSQSKLFAQMIYSYILNILILAVVRSFIQKHKPCVDLLLNTKCHINMTIFWVCMHIAHVCYMGNYHVLCNSKFRLCTTAFYICLVLHVLQLMARSQHMLHDVSYHRSKSIKIVYIFCVIKLFYMIIISFAIMISNLFRSSCTIRVVQCYNLVLMYNIIHYFFIIILLYLYSICTHMLCHFQPAQLYSLIPCTRMYPHCQAVRTLLTLLNIAIIPICIHVHTFEHVDSLQTYKYNAGYNEHVQSLNKIYHIKTVSVSYVTIYMYLSPALFHYHYSIFINDIYLTMRSYANVKLLKIVIMLVLNKSNSIASYYFSMFVFIFTKLSNCLVTWLHKKRIMKSTRGYNVDFVMHFVKLHTIYTIYYMTLIIFLIEVKLFPIAFNSYIRYSVYIIVYEIFHNG